MRNFTILLLVLCLLVGSLSCEASESDQPQPTRQLVADQAQVSIRVSPQVATEPATITVIVRFVNNAGNRVVCVLAVDADGFVARRTCRQLDGTELSMPVLTWTLGAGDYEISATLARNDDTTHRSMPVPVRVLSRF